VKPITPIPEVIMTTYTRSELRAWLLIITTAGALSACAGVPAQYRTSRLAIQKSGLATLKYSMDGSKPEKVHGFVTYRSSFLELLSQQPSALAEAKRAVPYHYAAAGVALASTAYALTELVAAVGGSDGETLGELDEASAHAERGAFAGLGGIVGMLILSKLAQSHMYGSVGMFNEGLKASNGGADDSKLGLNALSVLPNTFRLDPKGSIGIGWTVHVGGRR
jgi:hypothetical protein